MRRRRAFLLGPVLLLCFVVLLPATSFGQENVTGRWDTLPYTIPVNPIHVALLHTGKVLIAVGSENDSTQTFYRGAVYDPKAGTFTLKTILWDLFCNGMAQLPDGRILIVGGNERYGAFEGITTTTIFDPATEDFIQVHDMAHGRWYPSNATLGDGRVLTIGGFMENGANNDTVELYRIGEGWSAEFPTGFVTPKNYPRIHLLPNGKIFLSGSSKQSRFYDPATPASPWTLGPVQTYVAAPGTKYGERMYGSSVLLGLRPEENYAARVVAMGGDDPATNTAEMIDLSVAAPAWTKLPDMVAARIQMNGVLLPNGKVLALGGSAQDRIADTAGRAAQIFDPVTRSWSAAGTEAFSRLYHSVGLLLPDATVWVAGSNPYQGSVERQMEIYSPPYLFTKNASGAVVAAPRPTISSIATKTPPDTVRYGETFTVATPTPADIADVVLVRLGTPTHAFNFDQRLVALSFMAAGTGALTVSAPPEIAPNGFHGPNIAPPGYYMLFLINRAGTPSVATFVKLAPNPPNQPPKGTITVLGAPTGDVTITAGESVTFAGSATDPDGDGTVTGFSWVFPGGTPFTSNVQNPSAVTFSTPGTYVVSLTVTDNAGATDPSPPTRTIVVKPAGFTAFINSPQNGGTVTGDQTVVMSVDGGGTTLAPPFTYVLKIDGVEKFRTTVSNTSASYVWPTVQEQVPAGSHTLTLTVADANGHLAAPASIQVVVDNGEAMQAFITGVLEGQTVSGVTWATAWIKNAGASPYQYEMSVNGSVVWTQTTDCAKQTNCTGPVTMPWDTKKTPNGPATLTVRVSTALKTASATVHVTVSNGPSLTASITSPIEGATVSGDTPVNMTVSGGSPNYTFTLKINGAVASSQTVPGTTATFTWPTANGSYPNGSYTLSLTVTDASGLSGTATRTVTVSNAGAPPPASGELTLGITSPRAGATVTPNASGDVWVTVWLTSTTSTAPYTYRLLVGSQPVWTVSGTSSKGPISIPWDTEQFPMPSGLVTLTVTVSDGGGKTGSQSVTVTFQSGTTAAPLNAAITSPAAGATVSGTITVGMSAGGGTPPYTYALKVDATAFPAIGPTSATTASQSWDTTTVANGTHTLTLTVTDNSGATKTVSQTVNVSNTASTSAPLSVAITSPRPNTTVTPNASNDVWVTVWLTGTDKGTPVYTYKLSVDGQQVWSQSSSSTGPVSLPWPTGTRPSGPATLTVAVTDANGRTGSASVSITFQRP